MADAGEIKARVTVEYDGSGVDKAKSDLQSLAEIAGGSLAEGASKAGDGLAQLEEQAGKTSDGIAQLAENASSLEKPFANAAGQITSVSEVLGEHQALIESTGQAYESIQKPIGETAVMLEAVQEPMLAIAKSAESMQAQMSNVGDGFTQVQESLSQAVPLLPQFADNLHTVSEAFDPKQFGLNDFTENMGVFQDALSNPQPFSMIQQHLKETGQTWDDFSSSIGEDNVSVLHDMATNAGVTHTVLNDMSSSAKNTGTVFTEAMGQTEAFTKQFGMMNDTVVEATGNINKFGGVGSALYGPEVPASMSGGGGAGMGFMESMGAAGTGISDILSFARPLMEAQMVGMMIGAVGTAIYNSAAIAEGPGAHGFGTFTGTVDAIGQAAQKTGSQFSEAFGQGVLPALNAVNYQMNTGASSAGAFGKGVGIAAGVLGDLAMIPVNPLGSFQGLANYGAQLLGMTQPFQGPGVSTAAANQQLIQQQISQIPVQLAVSTAQMQAQANNPAYLAAQAYLGSQTQQAQVAQQSYNISHYGGTTGPMDPMNAIFAQQLNPRGYGAPGYYADPNAAFFNSYNTNDTGQGMSAAPRTNFLQSMGSFFGNLFGGGNNGPNVFDNVQAGWSGGDVNCFPAGTLVLMADRSTKPIETLNIGERVLAHDGTKQVVTTVLARIVPIPKQVYKLSFSDDKTLTLTDSHPIMTSQGWKSLNPEETRKENPDLPVSTLQIGDIVQGARYRNELKSIEPGEVVPIYNITVDEPHTFYADSILVHNKSYGSQIMQNVADTTIPQMSLRGSNLIDSLASNFSGASMEHTFTATVNWAATGLEKSYTAVASWAAQGLSQAYTAVATWAATGLSQAYTAVATWASQGLTQAYTAVASWTAQNLEKPFMAVASWAAQGLQQAYTAVANWTGENLIKPFVAAAQWAANGLEHTFQGVSDWIGQNLEHTFTGIASWVGQNLNATFSQGGATPGFASGVQGFAGGWATVGEQGPELLYLPQGSNVYPQSSSGGFKGLDMSAMGNNQNQQPQMTHLQIMLDSRVIAEQTIPHIAPLVRLSTGRRAG